MWIKSTILLNMTTREQVFSLAKDGLKPSDIARKLSISRQRVSQILNRESNSKNLHILRIIVKDRDGWTCQWGKICKNKKRGIKLIIHHIDKDRSNNRIDNLITLCEQCHIHFHNLDRGYDTSDDDFGWFIESFKKETVENTVNRRPRICKTCGTKTLTLFGYCKDCID